jgi:hypothetical protein
MNRERQTPEQQLNWNNGEYVMTPSGVPSEPLSFDTPKADGVGGALSGVDAICGFTNGGR